MNPIGRKTQAGLPAVSFLDTTALMVPAILSLLSAQSSATSLEWAPTLTNAAYESDFIYDDAVSIVVLVKRVVAFCSG